MDIRYLLTMTTERLAATSTTPRLDAEILLAHVLGWTRTRLLAELNAIPDGAQVATFAHLVARRAAREPVAYLVGQREFYGLDLFVDQRVLIPRPETELLVELTLGQVQARLARATQPLVLVDVGTGSGAIAIALALHLPEQVRIYATDLSHDALAVAAANVARYQLEQRITLLYGDLLAPLPEQVDMLVSNPPYTVLSEIEPGVRDYEPHLALDGGADGLEVYQRLLTQAPRWLRPDGAILLEIGATQGRSVAALVRSVFAHPHIAVQRDLAGHPRVVVAQVPR